jgi:CheY-like chemotaxis protein
MVVIDLLEDIGYTVLTAVDGAAALDTVDSQGRIDLLVSDVGLPGRVASLPTQLGSGGLARGGGRRTPRQTRLSRHRRSAFA